MNFLWRPIRDSGRCEVLEIHDPTRDPDCCWKLSIYPRESGDVFWVAAPPFPYTASTGVERTCRQAKHQALGEVLRRQVSVYRSLPREILAAIETELVLQVLGEDVLP